MGMKEGKITNNLNHLISFRCLNPTVCGHRAQTQTHTHLSCCREGGSLLQQESCYLLMALAGGEVERGVAGGGGSIGKCPLLQQLLHNIQLSQTASYMQGCLVILEIVVMEIESGREMR